MVKSQACTVRLAVGTGCVHQEIGYCLFCVLPQNLQNGWRFKSLRCQEFIWFCSSYFLLHITVLFITHGVFLNESSMKFILQTKSINCLEICPPHFIKWLMNINVTNYSSPPTPDPWVCFLRFQLSTVSCGPEANNPPSDMLSEGLMVTECHIIMPMSLTSLCVIT